MTQYVGAIDQGTTSTRFMIFDRHGDVVGRQQLEHRQLTPRPGWVEHEPEEILARTGDVIRGTLARMGLGARDLAAVGVTNQRETTVVWDRATGRSLHPAIVWQDTRTDAICRRLAEVGGQDRFRARTGLPIATYFSGPKIAWLLENVDGLRTAAERGEALFGTVDAWLVWHLTGGPDGGAHVTDPTNASRTLLMDLERLEWDRELLGAMGIPAAMMPEIRPSSAPRPYGMTRADGPFDGEVPVCGILGDQQAALFGQVCFAPGEAKNTYGTGCFLLLNTGSEAVPSSSGLLTTVAYRLGDDPPAYALEGSVAVAGSLVQWLRDNLGIIDDAGQVEDLAGGVDDNGGMYLVPAFSGLFAPHWRADARGVMVGLSRYIRREHVARAALEATAYQSRELLDAMRSDAGEGLGTLKVDGGMVVNELLMQFQADLLDVPVVRPAVAETTCLGAAYVAGLAVGYWNGLDDLRANWREGRRWVPAMADEERSRLYAGWTKAVERTLDWVEP